MHYKNASTHPIDINEGQVLAPGETTEGLEFDTKHPFNKALIDEGTLIEAATTREPDSKKGGGS